MFMQKMKQCGFIEWSLNTTGTQNTSALISNVSSLKLQVQSSFQPKFDLVFFCIPYMKFIFEDHEKDTKEH